MLNSTIYVPILRFISLCIFIKALYKNANTIITFMFKKSLTEKFYLERLHPLSPFSLCYCIFPLFFHYPTHKLSILCFKSFCPILILLLCHHTKCHRLIFSAFHARSGFTASLSTLSMAASR